MFTSTNFYPSLTQLGHSEKPRSTWALRRSALSALGAGLAFGLALSALAQGNAGHTDTISPVASRSMDDGAMQLLEKQAEVPEGCYKWLRFKQKKKRLAWYVDGC